MNGRHRGGSPVDEPDTNFDPEEAARPAPTYVSTGCLPPSEVVAALVNDAHERFKSNTEGRNSDVYPSLAAVPADLFGVCVVGANGARHAAGDWDRDFTIMSVSKPFVFALVCQGEWEKAGGQAARWNAPDFNRPSNTAAFALKHALRRAFVHTRIDQGVDCGFGSRARKRKTLPIALTIIDYRRLVQSYVCRQLVDERQKSFHFCVDLGCMFGDGAANPITH